MSYCPPGWISDYHFVKALIYRRSQETPVPAARAASATNLLLWGEVNDLGEIVLHPAFAVDAPAVLPETGGPYRLTGGRRSGEHACSHCPSARRKSRTGTGAFSPSSFPSGRTGSIDCTRSRFPVRMV